MRARAQSGVSLLEVMIVVVIIGILIALAIPSFQAWIQNTQIRTAGESLINGLQTARNEAIRRNACMTILVANQTGWTVNPCSDCLADPPYARRAAEEGSVNAATTLTPPDATAVSFNSLGRVVNPNPCDGTTVLTQILVTNPGMTGAMAAEERRLQIDIQPGGSVRMCDPNPGVAIGDPRRC